MSIASMVILGAIYVLLGTAAFCANARADRLQKELNWHKSEPIRRQQQACTEGFRSAALNIGLGSMHCSREEVIRRQGIGSARKRPVKELSIWSQC